MHAIKQAFRRARQQKRGANQGTRNEREAMKTIDFTR
jgi:hypothetical protein